MPKRWAEVVDALWHDFGLVPVLGGGRSPRELDAASVIAARARHKPRSALGSATLLESTGVPVRVVTVDAYAAEAGLRSLDFVKSTSKG